MNKDTSVSELVANAEALLARLDKMETPETQALRDKVEAGVTEAKKTLGRQARAGAERLQDATASVVQYVQENPWVAVAAGTAIAVALIYIAFSGRTEDD